MNPDSETNPCESTTQPTDPAVCPPTSRQTRKSSHPLVSDTAAVSALLTVAEGKSTTNTLDASALRSLSDWCDGELDQRKIPKARRIGTTCWLTPPAQPNSHKWGTKATIASLRFSRAGWWVLNIERVNCWRAPGGAPRKQKYKLSEQAVKR